MLRFHGSKDKADFQFVGYNSRLDELQAAALRLFLEQLDGWNARSPRGGRALRGARARRARRAAGGRAGPRLPPLRRALARARRGSSARSSEAEIGERRLLRARRSTSSPRCASSATARARCPRPSARRAENFARPALGRGYAADAQERVVEAVRAAASVESRLVIPSTATASGSSSPTRRSIAAAWYLAFQLRFDRGVPAFYETLLRADDPDRRRRDQARRLRPLRLLQPLVALRLDAGHVAASSRGVTVACLVADLTVYSDQPRRARPAAARRSPRRTGSCCSRSRGRRAAARPHDHRSAPRRAGSSRAGRRCSSWARETPRS